MSRRSRVAGLAAGVTVLLVLAAIASHGRPLSSRGAAGGPTSTFFDYAYTTIVLVMLGIVVVAVYALLTTRATGRRPQRSRWHLFTTLLLFALFAGVAMYLIRHGYLERLRKLEQAVFHPRAPQRGAGSAGGHNGHARNARVRWDEVAVIVALLTGAVVFLVVTRTTRRPPRRRLRSHDAVSLALDESLDDLRNEPDLRRAIIAAYARMERALAHAGTPRLPSEAPLEYLERALRELDTSADAVRRLTDLFEWAKFSHHEPMPEMRDEAIDALVALRDELRRPAEAAVA
jgi:hypothetical protein